MLGLMAYATMPTAFLIFKNTWSLSKLTFEPYIYLGLKEDPRLLRERLLLMASFSHRSVLLSLL